MVCFFLLFLVGEVSCRAGDCPYGSAQAWFKDYKGLWENATAHPVLHQGAAFEIRVVVTIGISVSVFFLKLHEFGTPVYEVIEGPSKIEQILEQRGMMKPGMCFSYAWKLQVRTDTSWVNGYAPLELSVQFNKNDEESASVHFDVLTAFITDEPMEHHLEESLHDTRSSPNAENHPSPSNGIGEIILLVVLFVLLCRGSKLKGNKNG